MLEKMKSIGKSRELVIIPIIESWDFFAQKTIPIIGQYFVLER